MHVLSDMKLHHHLCDPKDRGMIQLDYCSGRRSCIAALALTSKRRISKQAEADHCSRCTLKSTNMQKLLQEVLQVGGLKACIRNSALPLFALFAR